MEQAIATQVEWGSFEAVPAEGDRTNLQCDGYVFEDWGEALVATEGKGYVTALHELADEKGAEITDIVIFAVKGQVVKIDVDWVACGCVFGYEGRGCSCNADILERVTRIAS